MEMLVAPPEVIELEPNPVVVQLGAQGARLDPETGMRELSEDGKTRILATAALIKANPYVDGEVVNVAGFSKLAGGGPEPTVYAETEAAAQRQGLNTLLGVSGTNHNWQITPEPPVKSGDFSMEDLAGTTVEEFNVVLRALRARRDEGRTVSGVYFVGGPTHLLRVGDMLNAVDPSALGDIPKEKFHGIATNEQEGVVATLTRLVYKHIVLREKGFTLRSAKDSLTPEQLLAREAKVAPVFKLAFGALSTVKGIARGLGKAGADQQSAAA